MDKSMTTIHRGIDRRTLIKLGSTAGLSLLMPSMIGALLGADEPKGGPKKNFTFDWNRTLVLIELRGGNDGLNTVIPFSDPAYYEHRKGVAIAADEVVKLNKDIGLHPSLKGLEQAWADKDLAIVRGLGYPHPNRSHFRGIDIWHGGSKHDEMAHDGWIARVVSDAAATVPAQGTDATLADGIVFGYAGTVGHAGFGPLYGQNLRNLIMNSPEEFIQRARNVPKPPDKQGTAALKHVLTVQGDIANTANKIEELRNKAPDLGVKFPGSSVAKHAEHIAKLIAAGAKVPVFKLTIDGFDTHANQKPRHEQLLRDLGGAMTAFREALMKSGHWDKVMVMTYSEFGRRVIQNDSGGTDHGTAAPHFVMGGKVKGGFHGDQPSLTKLDYGDLAYTTDYRSLYLSVAQEWWGWNKNFLSEKKVKPLGLIRSG